MVYFSWYRESKYPTIGKPDKFAQFFNGQVVELDDDLGLNSEPLKPSKAAAQQPSHPDKDVPF